MALSKPFFHLRYLTAQPRLYPLLSARLLSFATPEEAAAERRRRKRRLRIEPPLNALRNNRSQPPIHNPKSQNPNAPKLPDSVSVLTGPRLNLHNRILTLIRENDLSEASLLVRHSIYSNCRPTVFTCNAVLAALIRQSKYSDFLSLHRFITQAGVVPNLVTYNLLINAYLDCRKYDHALDHYKILINDAPFNPSPTTYRILVRVLASAGDSSRIERAISLKDEMLAKGIAPDPVVYDQLISGLVKLDDPDRGLEMFCEFKEKLEAEAGPTLLPEEIVRVYGSLMKGYFKKGMDKEAMDCLEEVFAGENGISRFRIGAVGYNSVLDALSKNGKTDDAVRLFDLMKSTHNPPKRITVNLGSFNVMVDMFCGQGKFNEAMEVFRKMEQMKCVPDTLSYNNLIQQLCCTGMVAEAEEIYREMGGEKGVNPDEFTYVLLIDACFGQNGVDEADTYFGKMVESGLRPNVAVYNKVMSGLVKAGKIERAKEIFDQMVEKELKPDGTSYDVIMKGMCEGGKLDDLLKMVGEMINEDESIFSSEMNEFVTEALKKEGREEELARLFREKEEEKKKKEEALAKEAEVAAANAIVASDEAASKLVSNLASIEVGSVENLLGGADTDENGGTGEEVKGGDGSLSVQATV